ncbi:hypothetical protein RclHR1_05180002 [Rhizophagus clarus]|uniref:G-protein coupled receptors family 1 profile domain-containing protein n=1 Tax=Rhizophagus clarus TaxID=94130 RepID=A0A2Z6RYN1_9GLOM|nr:hypothetical protein RclHR1_05180002 [Rhizophagus clarus]GES82831.1 hypothetical protein GLOIN_2v1840257 [Rhizophagus clarus]
MQSRAVIIIDNSNRFPAIGIESSISLIFAYINIISCSYVLSRLYFARRLNEIKYPSYFAITYLMYSILQIIYVFIKNSSFFQVSQVSQDGIFYKIFETFYPTFLTVNLLLIGFLEFSTLSKINKRIEIETGKYDIYMWQGLFFLSWIASIFGINRYEQLELNQTSPGPDAGFEYHLNAILIFIVVINTISYFVELRKILHKVISREFLNIRLETCDYMSPTVIRSYLFCIIPFLFQWSLILLYNIIKSFGFNDLSLNILLIIAVNIGGIGHGISYFIYERKYLITNFPNIHPIILSYGALLPTDDRLITISTL